MRCLLSQATGAANSSAKYSRGRIDAKDETMRLKLFRKSSVSVPVLMRLFAALTFGQGIEAQEDPAGKKQASSDAQKGAVAKKDASAAAEEELQKAVQNPVASLISVPLQNNTHFSLGSFDRTQDVLNIQPVIPANLSENWMINHPRHPSNYLAKVSDGDKRAGNRRTSTNTHVPCNAAKLSSEPTTRYFSKEFR